MHSDKEKEWIDAFRKGEPQAIEKVVSLYGNRLLRSAFLLCGIESDARDLVQESFLQAIKSMHRFKGKSTLYTWLYGIMLNVFRQYTRKKRQLIFSSDLDKRKSSSKYNFEQNLDREKIFSQVYDFIQTLSSHHREVLILRYYEGLKIKEIAEMAGISAGTVKSRLHYATEVLRKKVPSHLNLFSHNNTNNKEIQ